MVRINEYKVRYDHVLFHVLILGILLLMPSYLHCRETAPPLLLSLDVELDSNVQDLSTLGLKDSATYFVTGEFARKFPDVVKELSQKGTVGSHSHAHPNLTELTLDEVRRDLQASVQAIASATGEAPVWFRAPYLQVNEKILGVAHELGFSYDSSEPESWLQQQILSEFPISINDTDRILFSDYDFFSSYGFDDAMALDMLKENYLSRHGTGRPFVFLLHPGIIVKHREILHQFIAFVKEQGGNCLSFDQYLGQILSESPDGMAGVRIDLSHGPLDVERTVSELVEQDVTDVFISARDQVGRVFYGKENGRKISVESPFSRIVHGLHNAGLRVHAWIPVLRNAAALKKNPDQAMVDASGTSSESWVSPSHPQTLDSLKQTISDVLLNFPVVGIHLDELAYPSLKFDYSPAALEGFRLATGIEVENKAAANVLLANYYGEWSGWRSTQISGIAKTAAIATSQVDRDIILSAALSSESLTDFRSMEQSGQDYRFLARDLDMIVALPSDNSEAQTPLALSRFIPLSRFKIGRTSLLIDLPIRGKNVSSEDAVVQRDRQFKSIRQGADGVLLSPDDQFFAQNRAGSERLDTIRSLIKSFRQPLETKSDVAGTTPVSFVTEAQASLFPVDTQKQPAGDHSFVILIVTVGAGLSVFAFLGIRLIRKRRLDTHPDPNEKKIDSLNWQDLDKHIRENRISGQLVQAVAGHLRTHDPVSTSRYRMALVMDLVCEAEQQLSLNDLVTMAVDVPGWQVLAMSHLREAATLGYLRIDHDRISVTEKGVQELESMKAGGFDPARWVFVEQRLHENLSVSCPHCSEDNLAHWYWNDFSCSKCNQEVDFLDCTHITRKSPAIIALDQHYYV